MSHASNSPRATVAMHNSAIRRAQSAGAYSTNSNSSVLSAKDVLRYPLTKASSNPRNHWRAFIGEFIGTFTLLTACYVSGIGVTDDTSNGLRSGFIAGNALTAIIFSLGHVSGGHVNPAVTVCLMVVRAIPIAIGGLYIIAQLLGGLVAGAFWLWLKNENGVKDTSFVAKNLGFLAPAPSLFFLQVFVTGMLMWVVLSTGVDSRGKEPRNFLAPIPIGLAVASAVAFSSSALGNSLNPAGTIGLILYVKDGASILQWILYFFMPFVAAVLVGVFYKLLFMTRQNGLLSLLRAENENTASSNI